VDIVRSEELKGQIDIGIVTIRADEATSVLERFTFDRIAEGSRRFDIARLACGESGGIIHLGHIRCEDQGPDAAHRTTSALIQDLAPRVILLVGIAGTVPNEDI